jgi:uncharacterized protein (TIGR02466 family)
MDKLSVNPMWQTPVWEVQTELTKEFNESLLDEIYQIGKNIKTGVDTSPHDSLWDYNRPCLNTIKKIIIDIVTKKVREDIQEVRDLNISCESFMCWANIREPGEALEVHAHSDSAIAVTYYIKAQDNCGDLVLFDTKDSIDWEQGKLNDNPILKTKRLKPVEGRLVFFPSYVLHTVEENKSNDLRVSLTCDLKKVLDKNRPNTILLKNWATKMIKIREW